MQVGGQQAFQGAQVLICGTQQTHDEVGWNIDTAANLRGRHGSGGIAGRHGVFDACFLVSAGYQRVSRLL
ncbi:hypothetical protein MNVM_03370 [Mycobacterium novum]|uniref:Uncharacterized protein n=1 Tax=Mycobacterium novum TaxID=2492438 RepID=A0A7I7JH68_9MYCO|nr:hypothetical protein MNVM_03370 [Mycobacterium novum]